MPRAHSPSPLAAPSAALLPLGCGSHTNVAGVTAALARGAPTGAPSESRRRIRSAATQNERLYPAAASPRTPVRRSRQEGAHHRARAATYTLVVPEGYAPSTPYPDRVRLARRRRQRGPARARSSTSSGGRTAARSSSTRTRSAAKWDLDSPRLEEPRRRPASTPRWRSRRARSASTSSASSSPASATARTWPISSGAAAAIASARSRRTPSGGPYENAGTYDDQGHLVCRGKPVASLVVHGAQRRHRGRERRRKEHRALVLRQPMQARRRAPDAARRRHARPLRRAAGLRAPCHRVQDPWTRALAVGRRQGTPRGPSSTASVDRYGLSERAARTGARRASTSTSSSPSGRRSTRYTKLAAASDASHSARSAVASWRTTSRRTPRLGVTKRGAPSVDLGDAKRSGSNAARRWPRSTVTSSITRPRTCTHARWRTSRSRPGGRNARQ